jgi:peroxiredoxin
MMAERKTKIVILVIFGFTLMFVANSAKAENSESAPIWKCIGLLDEQTKSSLFSQERFFAGLFQLPNEYEAVSEAEKKRLVNRWIKELRGNDYEKSIEAAAYLGIVKATKAAKPLERRVITGGGGGRIRWVCTRSLGQIGDKSSIPLLISLLDNRNKDTRVYARISLAEITSVYFGDDKEKWKSWQSGKTPKLCTSTECKIGETNSITPSVRSSFSKNKLDFSLPDIYGRIVDSQDYANVSVLIMSGACWCGGCQQDAEPLRKIATEYARKGLQTIRTVAGDNELAGLDFQKHYRLGFVQLLDTNRSFEKRYNTDGWTFLMLADREGKIVYRVNGPQEKDWQQLRNILNDSLPGRAVNKTIIRDGIAYIPATLQRTAEIEKQYLCERFPSIACGPDDKIYVVFTTNRNGSSDVFIRVFDGSKWSEDVPIAATAADEYDGTVLVDKQGQIWICWTSNTGSRKYDIFVMSFTNPSQLGTPVRITRSDDDAMHPRMACDKKGRIWVTYYKWHKMGRYSRDKEVYLRRLENEKWSQEIQISPTDVPRYEDHSDPAISTYGNSVIVAWSWDFHPPNKGYSNQAETPTIFMRPVGNNMNLGKISCVSGKNIDVMPSLIATKNGQIWCAWDSLGWNQRKRLCVGNPNIGRNNPVSKIKSLSKPVINVCSPCFAKGPVGQLTVLWSEIENGRKWILKRADLDANNHWSTPTTVELIGNPRFCSAAYDSKGQLWITYSAQTKQGREIIVKNLGKNQSQTHSNRANNDTTSRNTEAINKLRKGIDEKYSYRDLRGIDWNNMFDRYEPLMQRAKTPEAFAEVAARMLLNAKDMHLWVKIDRETIGGFKRKIKRNYNVDLLKKEVPGWRDLSQYISVGCFPNGIGYILIKSWRKDENQVLKPALKALRNFSNNQALIIDVRPNSGGSEPFAKEIAGCFVDQPVVYAKHVYKKNNNTEGWGQIQERVLKPNKDYPIYRGKIAVLIGQANMSSCEAFLLMMKQVPNCKLIGDRSYGSSGNPKPFDLGNGVTVWLPSWKALRPDGTCFEGKGIKPDVIVRISKTQIRKSDRVLETALRLLRKP